MHECHKHGMCLGIMANSGAERRHEYGRRAAKKSLAGGCWKDKNPPLVGRENVFAFLTLKDILIWQYGTDVITHELALSAAGKDVSSKIRGLGSRKKASQATSLIWSLNCLARQTL